MINSSVQPVKYICSSNVLVDSPGTGEIEHNAVAMTIEGGHWRLEG